MNIVYLHGFASVGIGYKSESIRMAFDKCQVFSPDLPVDPKKVCELIENLLATLDDNPKILVGTSLGGFYAYYFSQLLRIPCILINPSMSPSNTLGKRVGTYINYANKSDVIVSPDFLEKWTEMENAFYIPCHIDLVSLFVARDDDVVSCDNALRRLCDAPFLWISPDGGHRYEIHWDKVINRIKQIVESR